MAVTTVSDLVTSGALCRQLIERMNYINIAFFTLLPRKSRETYIGFSITIVLR